MEEAVMKCQRCQREISEDESFGFFGEVLCDDCYMDAMSPAKACDPWAVYSATRTRESSGLTGVEGLTPLQQEIYTFIKNKGKVTGEEIIKKFNISQNELQNQIATLRHCELVRGQKEDNKVYIVPF
jgi:late competence protein required for DNA uptake (superfamily II DNA/RNA helicase)